MRCQVQSAKRKKPAKQEVYRAKMSFKNEKEILSLINKS
jgi:hypothetical protein